MAKSIKGASSKPRAASAGQGKGGSGIKYMMPANPDGSPGRIPTREAGQVPTVATKGTA